MDRFPPPPGPGLAYAPKAQVFRQINSYQMPMAGEYTPAWVEVLRRCHYPTEVIVLDFESFFSEEYGLKGMSTPEYINDSRWEVLGVAYLPMCAEYPFAEYQHKVAFKYGEEQTEKYLRYLQAAFGDRLEHCTVVMQNASFDASVLAWRYGIFPKFVIDTKCLANAWNARGDHDLGHLCKQYGLPDKGETMDFIGCSNRWRVEATKPKRGKPQPPRRIAPRTPEQASALAAYACNDAMREWELFTLLLPALSNPEIELPIQQRTLEMFTRPVLNLDYSEADRLILGMEREIEDTIRPTGLTRDEVSGDNSFEWALSERLRAVGENPMQYMKVCKRGMMLALAKGDPERKLLAAHADETVRNLIAARGALDSWPLHIKRVRRMVAMAQACGGKMPVPISYWGAHTGRDSGGQKVNLQNLPVRGHPLIVAMRGLLKAPEGCRLVISDLAAIEARVNAWVSGQSDLIEAFAAGVDVYCQFGTEFYGVPVRKARKDDPPPIAKRQTARRQFSKVAVLGCIAEGMLVRTHRGPTPIQNLKKDDEVWDGLRFVSHRGTVYRGEKDCICFNGVWMTDDHEVLLRDGWTTAAAANTISRKSGRSLASLLSSPYDVDPEAGLSTSNAVAPAVQSLILRGKILEPDDLPGVLRVLKHILISRGLSTNSFQTPTAVDWLIECVQLLDGALTQAIGCGGVTGGGVSASTLNGSQTGLHLCNTLSRCPVGMTPLWRLTGETMTEVMSRAISDSSRGQSTYATPNESSRPVYDVLLAGPNRRFQAEGIIVSNCGYGMGVDRFAEFADVDRPTAEKAVNFYRKKYPAIAGFWRGIEKAFTYTAKYQAPCAMDCGLRFHSTDKVSVVMTLPNGRELHYHKVRCHPDEGLSIFNETTRAWERTWGGTLAENAVQAVARDVLFEAALRLEALGHHIAHRVHDELILIAPTEKAPEVLALAIKEMSRTPAWAPGLPLNAEGVISERYSNH